MSSGSSFELSWSSRTLPHTILPRVYVPFANRGRPSASVTTQSRRTNMWCGMTAHLPTQSGRMLRVRARAESVVVAACAGTAQAQRSGALLPQPLSQRVLIWQERLLMTLGSMKTAPPSC